MPSRYQSIQAVHPVAMTNWQGAPLLSFGMPQGWGTVDVRTLEDGGPGQIVAGFEYQAVPPPRPIGHVRAIPERIPVEQIERNLAWWVGMRAQATQGTPAGQAHLVMVGGEKAVMTTVEYLLPTEWGQRDLGRTNEVFTEHRGRMYQFTFAYRASQEASYLPFWYTMLATVRWDPPPEVFQPVPAADVQHVELTVQVATTRWNLQARPLLLFAVPAGWDDVPADQLTWLPAELRRIDPTAQILVGTRILAAVHRSGTGPTGPEFQLRLHVTRAVADMMLEQPGPWLDSRCSILQGQAIGRPLRCTLAGWPGVILRYRFELDGAPYRGGDAWFPHADGSYQLSFAAPEADEDACLPAWNTMLATLREDD